MSISIPIRKGLKARRLAEERPDLSKSEIARLAGTNRGVLNAALRKDHFGRQNPKSRAQ
jgi:hypothetical protein